MHILTIEGQDDNRTYVELKSEGTDGFVLGGEYDNRTYVELK